ncbi:EF-hand domain-containing protein [Kordiimonas aquimaris]|uniref:hypothetical protein n=1 Tax=Kordiimonas aquimaris TaxID=707591 RepID=UPI00374D8DDE
METNNKSNKKSDVIEIRLPYDDKQAFMDTCKHENVTASAVLRDAITVYLERGHFEANLFNKRSFMMVVSGMIIGAIASAGFLVSDEDVKGFDSPLTLPYFKVLDKDSNERLSEAEFLFYVSGVYAAKKYPVPYSFNEIWFHIDGDLRKGWSKDLQTGQAMRMRLQGCDAALTQIARAHIKTKFLAMDTNTSGDLSLAEFSKLQLLPTQYELQREFVILDGNGDGGISLKEMRQKLKALKQDLHNHAVTDYTQKFPVPQTCTSKGVTSDEELSMEMTVGKWAFTHQRYYWKSISDEYYQGWDANTDGKLSFDEFIEWYL